MFVHPIWTVNQVFTQNSKGYFKGTGKTSPGHISVPIIIDMHLKLNVIDGLKNSHLMLNYGTSPSYVHQV